MGLLGEADVVGLLGEGDAVGLLGEADMWVVIRRLGGIL